MTLRFFPEFDAMRLLVPALFLLALLSCTSPTAPLPTGPNVNVTGTVVERLDGPPYSFLRVRTDKGDMWVAVPMAQVGKRDKVTVKHGCTADGCATAERAEGTGPPAAHG